MKTEYQLSGKPGDLWLTGLLSGPPLILLLSFLYAYILVYNPILILSPVIFLLYLFGIILILNAIFRISKCRNPKQAKIYGGLMGVVALYTTWITFLYVFNERYCCDVGLFDFIEDPELILDDLGYISYAGWFYIMGWPIRNGWLFFIWILEALGIFLAGYFGGYSMMYNQVFCEDCSAWAKEIVPDSRLNAGDEIMSKRSLKSNILALLKLPLAKPDDTTKVEITLNSCESCGSLHTMHAYLIKNVTDKKGTVYKEKEELTPVLLISKEEYQQFLDKCTQVIEPEDPSNGAETAKA